MRRVAQEGTRPEAWDWLEPDSTWEPEAREQASRRFFQVWNGVQGEQMNPEKPRATATLRANVPLRCTVWRGRVRRYRAILTDLILKDQDGLLAIYEKGFDEIYPDLQAMAQSGDSAAAETLKKIDTLLGRGSYKGEGVRPRLETTVEEQVGKIKGRNIAEQRAAVDQFYNELVHWPILQKKYLNKVVEDVWTDYSKRGGYDTGTSMAGGEMRTNRLFTFYLMKDPYPYLVSIPTAAPETVTESNTPDSPLEGQAYKGASGSVTPTFDATSYFEPTEGLQIYVQNVPNPDYDFMKITPKEVGTQKATTEKIRERVTELQRQSMFGNVYLSANVFEESPAFEGLQGVSLLALGREGTYDISDHERDVTKLHNGGLFRVPEGGLPEEKQYYPKLLSKEKGEQRKQKPSTKPSGGYEFRTSSRNLFAESLLETFGQEAAMPELWFDDQGNQYSSMDELMAAYDKQAWEEFQPQAQEAIREIIESDLGRAAAPGNIVQMPQAPTEEVQEVQPLEDYYHQEEEVPDSEEQLPIAARHVIRLVRVAKQLDAKGFYKEADKIDDVTRSIVIHLTQKVDQL